MPSNIRGSDNFDSAVAGHVIQLANFTTGTMATGTTVIPADDTIPQITEGTQFMSLAFTPKKANSKLKIEVVVNYAHTIAGSYVISALFRDVTANALSSIGVFYPSANTFGTNSFISYIDAVSTTSSTFTVRIGNNNAGTLTFNGQSGVRSLGGSLASSITITEIAQ